MAADEGARDWLSLGLIEGLGPRAVHALLAALGSPRAALDAPTATLSRIVGAEMASAIARGPARERLDSSLAWLDEPGHSLVTWADADYPPDLLAIADPPPVLFYAGRRSLLAGPGIGIVGSRNATDQGRENAEAFARALGEAGYVVVSGLALGIDAAAHRGGLASPSGTIAVVATGLDRVYPARNLALAHRIATEGGGLLSEFAVGTPAVAGHFPRRNRLISGLSRGVLVVEATLDSGSLITARLAGEQGRDVFAVPGSIHSPFSRGCHRLIRDGAKLVETAEDILVELRWQAPPRSEGADSAGAPARAPTPTEGLPRRSPGHGGGGLSEAGDEVAVLKALGYEPADADTLCMRTGLPIDRIRAILATLELADRVGILAGGRYQRRSGA